jgi:hypothetical protein
VELEVYPPAACISFRRQRRPLVLNNGGVASKLDLARRVQNSGILDLLQKSQLATELLVGAEIWVVVGRKRFLYKYR